MQGRSRVTLVCVCLLLVSSSIRSAAARAASRMPPIASQAQNGPDAVVSAPSGAALRAGPGTGYRVIARLAVKTPLSLTGRNATSTWLQAKTATSSTGWVLASQIKVLLPNVKSLAIMSTGLPAAPRPAPLPAPLPAHSPAGPLENVNIGKLRAIFQKGQKLGNRARAFSKIGDSSVRDQQFLYGFGLNKQTLGAYSYLQATVDFFSIPARPGFANSFVNESLAAVPAFNAAAAFDASWTSWTDPNKVCTAEEGPLDCELRVVQPSILIIKLGLEDMFVLTPDEYRMYLHQIVLHTMERGTIPLLCTFASNPHESKYPHAGENAVKLNQVIREIAAAEQIPLLELRAPVMRLPDLGLNPEGIHVSDWAGDPYNFSGDQERWGITLVNLLTLQMLDRLRVEVLAR